MFRSAKVTPDEERKVAVPGAKPGMTASEVFLIRYRAFCYRVLGERFDRAIESELLAERLKAAGVNATPGMHRAVLLITTVVAVVPTFVFSLVLFHLLLNVATWPLYVLVVTGIVGGSVVGVFTLLVGMRISNRRSELERELPFTLSELSVLASTGMSPIELIRRMARRDHDPAMTSEFRKIAYKADVQGKDLISALAETAKESPSNSLRESLWDLANMIHQGGNLDEYLRNKSDDVLKLKRIVQKEFIERLQTFVDMYISLVLVGVLLIAVAAFLINAFGSTAAGLDANELLLLLTFGLVPVAVGMTATLISMAYARAE
ncbi:MAG TPA: type II secretion system F family protein [Thermoplasmata archaeon]|nr:type II secretion system F family protein [Thermoplasmata archaeon]